MSYLITSSLRAKVVSGCTTSEEIKDLNVSIEKQRSALGVTKLRNSSLIRENTITFFLEKHNTLLMLPGDVEETNDLAFEFFDGETNSHISIHDLIAAVEKDDERLFVEVKVKSPWADEIRRYLSHTSEHGWVLSDPWDCSENGDHDVIGTSDEVVEHLISLLWRE